MRPSVAVAAVVLLVALSGCGKSSSTSVAPATQKPAPPPFTGWIARETTNKEVVVVFIHGIFGDAVGTWTNDAGKTFFQLLKEDPQVGDKIDIYAFGFESSMWRQGSLDIEQAAEVLETRLKRYGVLDYPRIVLATHSMGGLVAMRFLLRRPAVAERVPLLVKYATPHEGSQIANIADLVARNPALKNLVGVERNTFLRQLDGDWERAPNKPHVACAYETVDYAGVRIVPWASATRTCGANVMAVAGADHVSIVKPRDANHDSVSLLVVGLQEHVLKQPIAAKLETNLPLEDGNLTVTLATFGDQSAGRLTNVGGAPLQYRFTEQSSSLYVAPYPTPRILKPNEGEEMLISLRYLINEPPYRFKLKSTSGQEFPVLVKVSESYRAGQQEARTRMLHRMESATATLEPDKVTEQGLVKAAQQSVAEQFPKAPAYLQSIIAADLLNAANLPTLAAVSLRDAEKVSQEITQAPSVQSLAGTVARRTGDDKVFVRGEIAKPYLEPRSIFDLSAPKMTAVGDPKVLALAERLQKNPALEAYGLSLQGDALAASGDWKEAAKLYDRAYTKQPNAGMYEMAEAATKAAEDMRSRQPLVGESHKKGTVIPSEFRASPAPISAEKIPSKEALRKTVPGSASGGPGR